MSGSARPSSWSTSARTSDPAPARGLAPVPGVLAGVTAGVLAGAVAAGAAGIVLGGGALPAPDGHAVQAVADVVVAGLLVALVPRDGAGRRWALARTVPLAWVAARGLDVRQAVVG